MNFVQTQVSGKRQLNRTFAKSPEEKATRDFFQEIQDFRVRSIIWPLARAGVRSSPRTVIRVGLTWCVRYPATVVSWTPDCPWHAIRWGTTDRSRSVVHSNWPSRETVHLENSFARVPYRTPCATSARPTWKTKNFNITRIFLRKIKIRKLWLVLFIRFIIRPRFPLVYYVFLLD